MTIPWWMYVILATFVVSVCIKPWLLIVYLCCVNAFVPNDLFLQYRWSAAGVPINVLDIGLGIALLACLLPANSKRMQVDRTHPLFGWFIVTCVVACLGGLMTAGSRWDAYYLPKVVTGLRNFLMLPACMIVGYTLTSRPSQARAFGYVATLAGMIVGILILIFFLKGTGEVTAKVDLETVRIMLFPCTLSGISAATLVYALGADKRIFPKWFGLIAAGITVVGSFATLSRSDWISGTFAIVVAVRRWPKTNRGGKLIGAFFLMIVLAASLWGGIMVVSKVSGRDFTATISRRFMSMLPGEHEGVKSHAWDTRVGGVLIELQLWSRGTLVLGRGFAIQDSRTAELVGIESGFRHNTYVSFLLETGLIGLAAAVMMVAGLIVVGLRTLRAAQDAGTTLLAVYCLLTGFIFIPLGYMTMTFNQPRGIFVIALPFGVLLRCRAMQLTAQRQEAASAQPAEYDYDPAFEFAPRLPADGSAFSAS